ncbi:hypothetical protein HPB48_018148 [Haemaphysalis longicornis]|uniref:Vitellogenin-2 n=1 Tax=Haemaphysalis longicornis TaxID=44386 RepID=A0A9J6FUD7_HAELO|nr:hypothetical protein HPB48_018148 [Haemaphysalis longicornis]
MVVRMAFVFIGSSFAHCFAFVHGLEKLARLEYTDEDIKEIDQKESGGLSFLMLFQMFATMNYDEINDAYRTHVANAPDDIKDSIRHLFLDLLAATGLNPHVTFGIDLIKNNELSASDADRFYMKLHLNLKEVSPAMIRVIAYTVTPHDVHDEPEYKTTVYLRAAGNLATRKALHYLERFIYPEWHANEHKRMSALWALKQAAKHHKELARSIALPVFFNETEPSEIRIATFLVVVVSDPDLYLLRHIALEMITEPSDQVTHFVASAFHSLAESKYPCHREIAQHLRYVLPLWQNTPKFNKPVNLASSHMQIDSGYNEKYDFGGMTLVEMIRSHDSFLPRNCYLHMKDYIAGRSHDTLALSFESWGLDRLINGLVGPQPGSTKSLWDILGRRRFPRDASAKERKEIEDALPIADREYDPVYARLSLSLFGKAVDSWDFDESVLIAIKGKEAAEKTAQKLLENARNKKVFYLTQDMTFMAPTELGVPVFFDYKQAEFIYANIQEVEITHGDMAEINLNLKRHYLYEVRSNKYIATALTFDKTSLGSGIDQRTVISWPLELKATLSILEGKLKLHRPLGLPHNIGNHYAHPFTFKMPYDLTKELADPVTAFAQLTKPLYHTEDLREQTHVFNLDVHFRGDTKDRKAESEFRYSFSHDLFKHKMQFFYDRSQFSKDPHSALKITINGQFTHTDDDERQITNAAAGKPLRYSLARPNGLHRMYAYCEKKRASGVFYNYFCLKFLRHSSRLAKFTADVEYKNYKPVSFTFPLFHRQLLKCLLPSYGSELARTTQLRGFLGAVRAHFHGENGKLHVVSQVPWWSRTEKPHTDIVITTEDGHKHHHWNVPIFSHMLEPRVFSSLGYSNFGEYSKNYKHSCAPSTAALCRCPRPDCYKVVSRDCSPNKRFLLLARATGNPSFSKAVKLFIDTTKVEILPVTDASAPIVRVDGTKVDVTPERPYSHTSHDAELFEVRTENKWFEVVSKPYGISLNFNGNMLFVQVSRRRRGKPLHSTAASCAACAVDYNLDRSTDLSGPDGHLYNNTLEFASSYVVHSPDCHA